MVGGHRGGDNMAFVIFLLWILAVYGCWRIAFWIFDGIVDRHQREIAAIERESNNRKKTV
jgi:hypothetical protein